MQWRVLFLIFTWLLLIGGLRAEESARDPFRLRVLVLNYDPVFEGQPLHKSLGFNDPRELVQGYVADMQRASGGLIQYEIAQWRDIDGFYARTDGGIYQVDEYVRMRRQGSGWPEQIVADYPRLLREQNVIPLIDDGSIDEVWVFGDHYFGLWEASMAGPGAFFVNGGVYPEVPSARPFVLYGFNYERGVAEMLHNTAHRVEATMNRVYGQWNLEKPSNNWELFSANVEQSNGVAGIGTCHWPANAQHDYDYGNRRDVLSHADDFLNYPNLTGQKKKVSARSWSPDGADPHRGYMNWYFERIPRAPGVNPDGKLNNWWNYIVDFQNYGSQGQQLPSRAMVVKWRKAEDSIAVMVAFQSSGGVDPANISVEDAYLSVAGQQIQASRVHLPRKDRGAYRAASFVFPIDGSAELRSADFRLVADAAGLAPFEAATWRLNHQGERAFAIPLDNSAETAKAAARWVLDLGARWVSGEARSGLAIRRCSAPWLTTRSFGSHCPRGRSIRNCLLPAACSDCCCLSLSRS